MDEVSRLSHAFLLLWVQSLGFSLTMTYRHTDYAGSQKEVYKVHMALRVERILAKLQ